MGVTEFTGLGRGKGRLGVHEMGEVNGKRDIKKCNKGCLGECQCNRAGINSN